MFDIENPFDRVNLYNYMLLYTFQWSVWFCSLLDIILIIL